MSQWQYLSLVISRLSNQNSPVGNWGKPHVWFHLKTLISPRAADQKVVFLKLRDQKSKAWTSSKHGFLSRSKNIWIQSQFSEPWDVPCPLLFLRAGRDFRQTSFSQDIHGVGNRKADFLTVPLLICFFLLPRRKSLREEGRIMAEVTGHCTDCLVVKTASAGFVRGNIKGTTWYQKHGSSLPCSPLVRFTNVGGSFCQTMTLALRKGARL